MSLIRVLITFNIALVTAMAQAPPNAKFQVLYTFPGGPGVPNNIHEISPGLFYGSTGGDFGTIGGEIFSIDSAGAFKSIRQFQGFLEADWVMPAEDGKLFGSISQGGNRPSYFTINYNGAQLKSKPTGPFGTTANGYPYGIPAADGAFYAVMGSNRNALSVVKVTVDGTITSVHAFSGSEGQPVIGTSLLRTTDGSFYGINTLPNNGSKAAWVYKLTPDGNFTKLGELPLVSLGPTPPMVLAPDGTVYGATYQGGANFAGQIFKIPPGGPLSILTVFPAKGMFAPTSLLMADDGNLYGTTHSEPSYFFRVLLPSGTLQEVYVNNGAGAACTCPMLQGSDGKFYGVSLNGGTTGAGTIFSLDVGIPPPPPAVTLVAPASGAVGTAVLLWGTNLLGATSVTFSGTSVSKIVIPTSQSVFVDVPAGAVTGPITIETPNGSFTTTTDFTVE